MPLITATWTITLGGVTLLDAEGDLMNDELSVAQSGQTQAVQLIGASYASAAPRGNVTHRVSFTRVTVFGTPLLARLFLLTHTRDLAALRLVRGEAAMRPLGGDGLATLADCLLAEDFSATTENDRFTARYTLLGGEWTYAAAGDALLNQDGTPLLNPDGTPLINQ